MRISHQAIRWQCYLNPLYSGFNIITCFNSDKEDYSTNVSSMRFYNPSRNSGMVSSDGKTIVFPVDTSNKSSAYSYRAWV